MLAVAAEKAAGVIADGDKHLLLQDNLDAQLQPEHIRTLGTRGWACSRAGFVIALAGHRRPLGTYGNIIDRPDFERASWSDHSAPG